MNSAVEGRSLVSIVSLSLMSSGVGGPSRRTSPSSMSLTAMGSMLSFFLLLRGSLDADEMDDASASSSRMPDVLMALPARFNCFCRAVSRVFAYEERGVSRRRGSLPGRRDARDADVLGSRAGVRSTRCDSGCDPELDPFGADDFSRDCGRPADSEKKLPDTSVGA